MRHTRKLLRIGDSACLFCLAPDGVFRTSILLDLCVRSYRTFSPLPIVFQLGRYIFCGTFHELTPSSLATGPKHSPYEASFLFGVQTFLPQPHPAAKSDYPANQKFYTHSRIKFYICHVIIQRLIECRQDFQQKPCHDLKAV